MSDWRRMKEEYDARVRLAQTRAVPVRRPARPLGHAVMRALAPILKEAGPAPDTLVARWPEIVGARIAAVTEPFRVAKTRTGGVLHLRAPSAAAPMIQHAAAHILQKVNLASGANLKSIRIVHTVRRTEGGCEGAALADAGRTRNTGSQSRSGPDLRHSRRASRAGRSHAGPAQGSLRRH